MINLSCSAAAMATSAVVRAAQLLLSDLEHGRRIDAAGTLRAAMKSAFGASDASGAWHWKVAYDACEAGAVLFLRKYASTMRAKAGSPASMLAKIAHLLPTHTRRREESEAIQQFSTPISLGFVASTVAGITKTDLVLEAYAGTGVLAILAEMAGSSLVLNELAEARAGLLDHLFPHAAVTHFDAAQINDHLDAGIARSIALMNPPFSALGNIDQRMAEAVFRHVASAQAHPSGGGHLVAIAGASFAPNPVWTNAVVRLQERGRVVFSGTIDGAVYRIELSDFSDTMREALWAYGLYSEIISWKLRVFVPTNEEGVLVIAKVLERYLVQHIGEREAA